VRGAYIVKDEMPVDAFLEAVLFESLELLIIELQLQVCVSRLKYPHDLCLTQTRFLVLLLLTEKIMTEWG
jgi:hypothetical protein